MAGAQIDVARISARTASIKCNLSMDDLKTARLRTRLPPWDIGLLERKLFGSAETRWQVDEA